MMHLISDIPEPAAYGANDRTKPAEVNAKIVCLSQRGQHEGWVLRTAKNIYTM
jgi:hypothetical protein